MKKRAKKTAAKYVTRVPLRIGKSNKMLLQAKVDQKLLLAVRPVAKSHRMTLCAVVEWGMKEFLAHVDPGKARDLHIEMNA